MAILGWGVVRVVATAVGTIAVGCLFFAGCASESAAPAALPGSPDAQIDAGPAAIETDASSCAKTLCSGVCVDPANDHGNCGACGHSCAAGELCSEGKCATNCGGGTTLCADTCRDLKSDPKNCGACETACVAGEVCDAGKCALTCGGGTTQCGDACVDTKLDPRNCGTCGTTCDAGLVCAAGACALACPPGLLDCNGACIDPQKSDAHCGAQADCQGDNSGAACAIGEVCSAGSCKLSCQAGLLDCDGTCIDPKTSLAHCGAQNDCKNADAGAACAGGQICVDGTCRLSCQQGLIDCNGTCVDPQTSNTFCGAQSDCAGPNAGAVCAAGEKCSGGTCKLSCQQGLLDCGGTCVNPKTSNAFCGAKDDCTGPNAGAICPQGQVCSDGTCSTTCAQSLSVCGAECIDLTTDREHCGDCATTCSVSQVCTHGQCCSGGHSYCGGQCIATFNDPNNCGDCGVQCGGGTPLCVKGACVASCPAGYATTNGKCAKTYVIPISQTTTAYQGDICATGNTKVYNYSYYQKCPNAAATTYGTNQFGFYWLDTAAVDGFANASRVDVTFFTTGYAGLETCPATSTTCTWRAFTETVALQGATLGSYNEGSSASPTCPGGPFQVSFAATDAELSGYQIGQLNQVMVAHPAPAACSSTSTRCCINRYYYPGMSVHAAWGAGAVALVTVTY